MESDNIIQLLFDKIFNKLTKPGGELFLEPFIHINLRTFHNTMVHDLIKKLTFKSGEYITSYLTNMTFKEKYLFYKLKNKLNVDICLGQNIDTISHKSLETLKFAAINNNLNVIKSYEKPDPSILSIVAEYGYSDSYFYLRSIGLEPNITVYNKAVQGPSLEIVKDVSSFIGLSEETITLAFEANHTDIIMYVVKTALEENIKIPLELISYPILNNNPELLISINDIIPIQWDTDFFYSAVLSGSINMVAYVESKLPTIHKKFLLDASPVRHGQKSLLSEEMVYTKNGKKYFSHVTNYAVQSKSIEVLTYVIKLGYGVTLSNIINAIQLSTTEILDFVLENYHKDLPFYLINYFNLDSYVIDKIPKFQVLLNHGFVLNPKISMGINDYKYDTTHLNLILTQKIILTDVLDPDYLIGHSQLFISLKPRDKKLITKIKMCIELKLDLVFNEIISQSLNQEYKQLIVDTVYLFGTVPLIKRVMRLFDILPNQIIISETLCYGQIGKLSLVIKKLNNLRQAELYRLNQIISDPLIEEFLKNNLTNFNPGLDIKFIVRSGKIDKIIKIMETNPVIDMETIKEILLLNDPQLIEKLKYHPIVIKNLAYIKEWTSQNDLDF